MVLTTDVELQEGIIDDIPIGPIGLLYVRKTLELGVGGTIAAGFGTAMADAVYAGIAAFGLAVMSEFF